MNSSGNLVKHTNNSKENFKIKKPLTLTYYHMLEHLLQLGVGMICSCFHIVISKSITKAFIKLL